MAILMLDKVNFRTKKSHGEKEEHYRMMTGSLHEDVAIFNAESPNINAICEGKADGKKAQMNPESWLETSTPLSHQLVEHVARKLQGPRAQQHYQPTRCN